MDDGERAVEEQLHLRGDTCSIGWQSRTPGPVRLSGPLLDRSGNGQLPSEGVVTGSIRVPTHGQPVLFLADHPTTGGYPVIAVVDDESLPVAPQAWPGSTV